MKNVTRKIIIVSALALSLGGCSVFDDIGRHLPVIGERCESSECFTAAGQAESDAKKRELVERGGRGDAERVPLNGRAQGRESDPVQMSPKAAAKPTPFDMPPDQLGAVDPFASEY